ncbi:thrombospondin type 3 repeat-containing protein [Luteolibacter luteus]|uniref:Uncharacterized protein n=1 Tax=Luteolibacter luteus TaxID=2728835 RepID=A0A858RM62_9BACT|nr:thrombospondin type 3 repeat-containing protein [Luteolibacter luteus]QJE97902.1 hypothetical protein HHL09_19630 [Luteolibacter luteus]
MKLVFQRFIRSALPVIGVGLLVTAAQAALVVPAGQGHVLLAFRDSSNPATGSYLVNIGAVSQFESASAGSTTAVATIGALAGDLDAFDTTEDDEVVPWHSRKQVVWSAFSRNAGDNDAIYISRPRTSIAQQSTPYAARSGFQHNSAFAEISSVIGQGFNVLTSTAGAPDSADNSRGAFQTSTLADAPVYRFQVATEGRNDFATWPNIEKDFTAGAANSAIDFYVHRKAASLSDLGTVTYLGYFSITTGGVVSFTRASAGNPNQDTDGDGFTDGDEAVAGTSPTDPASFFQVSAPVVVPGVSRTFSLQTIANRRYAVEYNDDLAGAWTEVYVHLSGAGATPLSWVDNDPTRNGLSHGFYRVQVTNP